MKRILFIILAAIFIFTGCSTLQPKAPPSLSELQKLAEQAGAAKVRAYTSLTGGGFGALDATSVDDLEEGDAARVSVISGSTVIRYDYIFDDDGTDGESIPTVIRPDDYSAEGVWRLTSIITNKHLTEIDSTDADDAYTMTTEDIGGLITNQGDDDPLTITLLEASTWYSGTSAYYNCIEVMDVEGLVITIDPADGTDQIIEWTNAAGDSVDSDGTVGAYIKLCVVGPNEIAVVGAKHVWVDGD